MIVKNSVSLHQNFDKMSIGKKVIQYRKLKNLSQSELAEKVKSTQSSISSLESDLLGK